jgi:hypothetical protein
MVSSCLRNNASESHHANNSHMIACRFYVILLYIITGFQDQVPIGTPSAPCIKQEVQQYLQGSTPKHFPGLSSGSSSLHSAAEGVQPCVDAHREIDLQGRCCEYLKSCPAVVMNGDAVFLLCCALRRCSSLSSADCVNDTCVGINSVALNTTSTVL